MDHKQTVDTGPSGHQFLSFARPLYIWGHVMSLSTTSFLFWMHALMHGTSIAYINMYMHAFCREKIKMETDIQREQSIIYMPWLFWSDLMWSDQQRRNHIDRSMQCNAIAVGACMHLVRSYYSMHALHCIAWPQYVRIYDMRTYPLISCALECVSGIYCEWVSGRSIDRLSLLLSISAASAYIYVHACVSVLVLQDICCLLL